MNAAEAGHPDATDLTRAFSLGNSDTMDIPTLGLELGRQDVPGLKNTRVNFLASGRSRQDVADPNTERVAKPKHMQSSQ